MQFDLDFTKKVPAEAQERIRDGMQRADDHADARWKTIIAGCILAAARRLQELTVDDVLEEYAKLPESVRPSTHALDALGPAMVRARKDGILKSTDRVIRSRRPEAHGNRHSVWLSNYYKVN